MGKIFRNLVICHTNDFAANKNEKIRGWIENNGGTFSSQLTSDVTHLLTSVRAWKRLAPVVKEARRTRRIKIVKLDWLEDSLTRTKPKRLDEAPYYYEQTKLKYVKLNRKAARAASRGTEMTDEPTRKEKKIEKEGIEFDKACQEFETGMASGKPTTYGHVAKFHLYQDRHGLVYNVNLFRHDEARNRLEKFRLQLYESDSMPYTYACFIQFVQILAIKTMTIELAPPGSTWSFAWETYQKFFEKRVLKKWSDAIQQTCDQSDVDVDDESFHYELQPSSKIRTTIESENSDKGPDEMLCKDEQVLTEAELVHDYGHMDVSDEFGDSQ